VTTTQGVRSERETCLPDLKTALGDVGAVGSVQAEVNRLGDGVEASGLPGDEQLANHGIDNGICKGRLVQRLGGAVGSIWQAVSFLQAGKPTAPLTLALLEVVHMRCRPLVHGGA